MGVHSYRNIGFSFNAAEMTCRKWRERFTGFKSEQAILSVTYFGQSYRLNSENGVLEKQIGTEWTDELFLNEALAVYHYLGDRKELIGESGRWVPESALDPVRIRTSDRTDPLFIAFAAEFEGKKEKLDACCESCGGRKGTSAGDSEWIFYPFPELPLRLVFWDMDEDFKAQVKVFVKENALDYVHYEAIGFMIADLFRKLQLIGDGEMPEGIFQTAALQGPIKNKIKVLGEEESI